MTSDEALSKPVLLYDLDKNTNHLENKYFIQNQSKFSNNISNKNILTNPHLAAVLPKGIDFDLASNISVVCKKNEMQSFDISFVNATKRAEKSTCKTVTSKAMHGGSCSLNSSNLGDKKVAKIKSNFRNDEISKLYADSSDPRNAVASSYLVGILDEVLQHEIDKSDLKFTPSCSNIQNLSEAGPDVADYIEEEFRSTSQYLNFNQCGNKSDRATQRLSAKFEIENFYHSNETAKPRISAMASDVANDISSPNCLINFNPTPKKVDHKVFTEDQITQAVKMQELHFHEKQLKKDKEYSEQIKILEKEKQMLKNQVLMLQKASKAYTGILEQMLKNIHTWMANKEQERIEMTSENQKVMKERDQALEDLKSVETAFGDLHRRYENCKTVLEGYKQNEDRLKQKSVEMTGKLKQQEQMYEMLRTRTQDKLESANTEIENAKKSGDAELAFLSAKLKKSEMRISSVEKDIEKKNKENTELSSICDDLIAKVGKS